MNEDRGGLVEYWYHPGPECVDVGRLEEMLEEVWDAPMPTEFLVMDVRTGKQFRVVSEEARRLREVCSPVGLARLFPTLKARTT